MRTYLAAALLTIGLASPAYAETPEPTPYQGTAWCYLKDRGATSWVYCWSSPQRVKKLRGDWERFSITAGQPPETSWGLPRDACDWSQPCPGRFPKKFTSVQVTSGDPNPA